MLLLSVKGVISVEENFNDNTLTVVFDDAVVSVDSIKGALKEKGYPVSGPPEYVEGQKIGGYFCLPSPQRETKSMKSQR